MLTVRIHVVTRLDYISARCTLSGIPHVIHSRFMAAVNKEDVHKRHHIWKVPKLRKAFLNVRVYSSFAPCSLIIDLQTILFPFHLLSKLYYPLLRRDFWNYNAPL